MNSESEILKNKKSPSDIAEELKENRVVIKTELEATLLKAFAVQQTIIEHLCRVSGALAQGIGPILTAYALHLSDENKD